MSKLVSVLCFAIAFVAILRGVTGIGYAREGELYDKTWHSAHAIKNIADVPSMTFESEYVALQESVRHLENLLWFAQADNTVNMEGENVRQWQEWEFVSSDFVQPAGDPGRLVEIKAPNGVIVEKVWLVGRVQQNANWFQAFGNYFSWIIEIVWDLGRAAFSFLNFPIEFVVNLVSALFVGVFQSFDYDVEVDPDYTQGPPLPPDWISAEKKLKKGLDKQVLVCYNY